MAIQTRSLGSTVMALPHSGPLHCRGDVALAEMVDRYGVQGGFASTDELISEMRPHWRQPISVLAKWIIGRKVVSFNSNTRFLIPRFQFARPRMTPSLAVADCALELGEFMDDQEFASWFVRPCEWLSRRMPVDILAVDADAVIGAASRTRLALMARARLDRRSSAPRAMR